MSSFLILQRRRRASGVAMLEMVLVFPVLLILALPVVDYGRNLYAQSVLTAMVREGANLASRPKAGVPIADIIESIAAAAPSLDMRGKGMIYVTELQGGDPCAMGDARCIAQVVSQHRWVRGGLSGVGSAAWPGCGASSWNSSGQCDLSGASPTLPELAGVLIKKQSAFVVEAYYHSEPIVGVMDFGFFKLPSPTPLVRAMVLY